MVLEGQGEVAADDVARAIWLSRAWHNSNVASFLKFCSSKRTKSESWEPSSLIAHGKDGFELAIPLTDLGTRPGATFDFICVECADNGSTDANRVSITLD